MEADLVVKGFLIIKGYIDARDEQGNAMFGTLLALASRREHKYVSVMFSHEEPSKSMSWNDLLLLLREKESERDRNPMITHHEEELLKFLRRGTVLNNVAKNHNTKQAEQSISRFCLEDLQLKAVSFVDYSEASDTDIAIFDIETERAVSSHDDEADRQEPQPDSLENEEQEEEKPDEAKEWEEIAVRCDPILAPVGGVAMNELNIGDVVMVRLPEDSVFFKLLMRNVKGFDGIVNAGITGILQNEMGTATISLSLAEGITGVTKMSGKVRIKTAQTRKGQRKRTSAGDLPVNYVFSAAFVIIVIAALAVLYYIFQ
ncbi:MAG: hypothetical protein FWE55_04070 [Synergistaceae bacterium]|nr:hypothetical protein [Synergistaceae bacterium]